MPLMNRKLNISYLNNKRRICANVDIVCLWMELIVLYSMDIMMTESWLLKINNESNKAPSPTPSSPQTLYTDEVWKCPCWISSNPMPSWPVKGIFIDKAARNRLRYSREEWGRRSIFGRDRRMVSCQPVLLAIGLFLKFSNPLRIICCSVWCNVRDRGDAGWARTQDLFSWELCLHMIVRLP